ncbi:bifunctional metallophosphatase/5'-nucleotidase [Tenacibaculum singaporense]|uniref:bifunctional metallophosphatase/5'-nucleotidase n=1 Tax=Tenacibaculum singaporense TaxID=2358479 RepID=UPI000F680E06|nr:bifunctional metallophosphatase/5'-nucleotidase [Tenacibaculum singaporense]RSC92239.1 bifunctional metallophosphatase/5'-nucleotidase [Tenacibaculum singaporense]
MKQFKILLLLLITYTLVSCGSSPKKNNSTSSETTYQFKEDTDKTYFTILQLNDVYEIAPIQGGMYGGMARVETVHKQLLEESKNTILVLAGDFLSPSLLGTMKYNGERVRGKQMVEVMNAMNFDLVAFGNHEFDLSFTHLQDRLNESKFDWISANVLHNVDGKHSYFHKVVDGKKQSLKDTFIKEFKNPGGTTLKVGFISVCIPSNPKSYVHYGDMYKEIQRSYNEIKDNVDIVLGLTHASLTQDKEIAKLLPNVPLIMGGHEHTNSYTEVGKVTITKADANAKTAYIHRFEYDPKTKEVNFKSELKEINKSIPFDANVKEVVDKWQAVLEDKIQEVVSNPYEVIYKATEPLDARESTIRTVQTNMGKIIAESMSLAYNNEVDCALVNGGSVRIDDVLSGDVNAVDIFRVLPYGGEILKVKIKGSLLKEVLDFGVESSGTGAYLQRYNAEKVGEEWMLKNGKLQENQTYTVAFSDYLLRGLDIPMLSNKSEGVINVYTPEVGEVAYDIRKAVVNFLKQNQI